MLFIKDMYEIDKYKLLNIHFLFYESVIHFLWEPARYKTLSKFKRLKNLGI